jgi:hypothetical protein
MTIRDTSKDRENPLNLLALGMFGGDGSAIEAQEAQGQRELCASQQLPVEITFGTAEDLEAMGIKLGPLPREGEDQLFRSVTLPEGWKIVATDHSMWSRLLDAKGRRRADIFYKAAFYDRCAHISLAQRFSTERDYDDENNATCSVTDCGVAIHRVSRPIADKTQPWADTDWARAECTAWLNENRPEWADPTKYWEE